jgi:predicted RNA-binding protein with PUA domain
LLLLVAVVVDLKDLKEVAVVVPADLELMFQEHQEIIQQQLLSQYQLLQVLIQSLLVLVAQEQVEVGVILA